MSELTTTIRRDTLKQLVVSYVNRLNWTIDRTKVYPPNWVREHISQHVEVFDLIETHELVLNPTFDATLQANLNFLRAQLEVYED